MYSKEINIPLSELENLDTLFFRQIQMKKEKALKKFSELYEETRDKCYKCFEAKGIYRLLPIECIEDDTVLLREGQKIQNSMISNIFKNTHTLVALAVTINGYEELDDEELPFMERFFYDGWGTAFTECSYGWLKKKIKNEHCREEYATSAWSPGQHNINVSQQKTLFEVLNPEKIGITLNKNYMMHPKKSITGIMGIGNDKSVENVRACDFCGLRETCPSAYATE